MVEALAVPQKSGKRTKGRSAEAAVGPGQSGVGAGGSGAFTLPVRFQTPVDENVLALFIASRVLVGETQLWREGIGHARRWFEETGGLDVPYSALVGEMGNYLSRNGLVACSLTRCDRGRGHAAAVAYGAGGSA
ncbi:hypothetical protein ACFU7Y_34625, partial [Kitasatospora sp. NPDC057542]